MGLLNFSTKMVPNPYYGTSSLMPQMVPEGYLPYLHAMMNTNPKLQMINPIPYPVPPGLPEPAGLLGTVRG